MDEYQRSGGGNEKPYAMKDNGNYRLPVALEFYRRSGYGAA